MDPSTISLQTIRFTNFDHETTDIFEKEFVRRYFKNEGETALMTKLIQRWENPKSDKVEEKAPEKNKQGSIWSFFSKK